MWQKRAPKRFLLQAIIRRNTEQTTVLYPSLLFHRKKEGETSKNLLLLFAYYHCELISFPFNLTLFCLSKNQPHRKAATTRIGTGRLLYVTVFLMTGSLLMTHRRIYASDKRIIVGKLFIFYSLFFPNISSRFIKVLRLKNCASCLYFTVGWFVEQT